MKYQPKKLGLIKLGVNIPGSRMLKKMEKASRNCQKSQHKVLMAILKYAKKTVYGQDHHFNQIKTVEDFQRLVPVNDYEDLRPLIMRHTRGEENVLFPGKPFLYATTSGTTKDPKWIPITKKYYRECYNGLTKLWFHTMLKEKPDLLEGPDLTVVGRAEEGRTEDGTPYGSFSGHVNKNIPKILKPLKVVPDTVYDILDYPSRYYVLIRMTIEHDIHWSTAGNPSTFLEIKRVVDQHINDFIDDIEKGSLKKDLDVPQEIRDHIESFLEANPQRAEELRKIRDKHKGNLLPKHYWPNLKLINTWTCGNSGLYLKHAKDYFPSDAIIREFGYLATEARAGVILDSNQQASILAAHLLFFEFIAKEDMGRENPPVLGAHELEKNREYYILITTPSGLYRYNMNDIVRIDGFYQEFPMITFVQKGAGVTSLTGEKLYEQQFLAAVAETEKEMDIKTRFHIAFADFSSSSYQVYIEFDDEIGNGNLSTFARFLDTKMKEMNPEYKAKRDSNRLKPVNVHKLCDHAFDEFKKECMKRGYRDGQFKLTHLMIDEKRKQMFDMLVA